MGKITHLLPCVGLHIIKPFMCPVGEYVFVGIGIFVSVKLGIRGIMDIIPVNLAYVAVFILGSRIIFYKQASVVINHITTIWPIRIPVINLAPFFNAFIPYRNRITPEKVDSFLYAFNVSGK